jgi:hypothetical protein
MASFGFAVEPRFRIAEKRFFEQRRATFAHAQEQSREKKPFGQQPLAFREGGRHSSVCIRYELDGGSGTHPLFQPFSIPFKGKIIDYGTNFA